MGTISRKERDRMVRERKLLEVEKALDKLLYKETPESFNKWLLEKRRKKKQNHT